MYTHVLVQHSTYCVYSRYYDPDCWHTDPWLIKGTSPVNLSRPSSRLWLYAGLTGSNNPRWLKERNGDELPRNGPCCLCKSFSIYLMGTSG